ncbi:MAG TPA: cache domain-containing protein [Methanolinea sp.]|nr:cache domain-containing protein [Methanolinea sp.]
MRRRHTHGIFFLVLVAAVLLSGCSAPGHPHDSGPGMTPAGLAGFVHEAAAFAGHAGKEAALSEFNREDGAFSRGDLYVYAYDYNGTLLAHPYQRESVGTNRLNWTDIRGLPAIRIGAHVAAQGGGFIAYLYPAPTPGGINESSVEDYVPKIGYVSPAGEDWWIASGTYFSGLDGAGPGRYPTAVEEMVGLVERGAAYGREHGVEAASAEISNASGLFVDANAHYLYAYDFNGTLLAHPHLKDAIGTSLIERTDPFGMKNIKALADTARSGGGFIVFVWPNPARENRQEMKIGYVLPVDDRWWLGSGVYLSEVTGMDTSFPLPNS